MLNEKSGQCSTSKQSNTDGSVGGASGGAPDPDDEDDGKSPSTPVGRRGEPIEVKRGTNSPSAIYGRQYTGHALDQMQGRGVTPSAVENAITSGIKSPGNLPNTFVYTGPNGIRVVTNSAGRVITVTP